MARNVKILVLLGSFVCAEFYGAAADPKNANAKQPAPNNSVESVAAFAASASASASASADKTLEQEKVASVRFDPLQQSAEEDIHVFIDLAKRDQELRAREQALKKEYLFLRAAETSLDEKLKQFNMLKTDLEKLLKRLETNENKQTADLVQMYEAMKPKQAAAIINKVDLVLAVQIIKRMNKKKAAFILAALDSKRAKDVTQGLALETQNITMSK